MAFICSTRSLLFKCFLAAAAVWTPGCRPFSLGTSDSEGLGGDAQQVAADSDGPAPKSAFHIYKLAQSFFAEASSQMSQLRGLNPRKNTASILIKTLRTEHGLPRRQLVDLFSEIHKSKRPDEVARVIGLKPHETETFLDDLYWQIHDDKALLAANQTPWRTLYLKSVERPATDGPMPKPRTPLQVVYYLAKGLKRTGLQFAGADSLISFDFYPRDFRRARKVKCAGDVCEAEFVEPFSGGVNVPIGLLAYVTMRYSKAISLPSDSGRDIEHSIWVGGGATPFSLFGLISITIDLSMEILNKVNEDPTGSVVERVTDVRCYGSVSCDTPLFSVMASVDSEGFDFISYLNAPGLGDDLAIVYPLVPSVYKRMDFSDAVTERLNAVKNRLIKNPLRAGPALNPDVYWNAFVGLPPPETSPQTSIY